MDRISFVLALGERGDDLGITCDKSTVEGRSLTHQSFAKDADINNIMKKYAVSGVLVDPMNVDSSRVPRFGDFSDIPDYSVILARINQAQADFMTLPADVRARFSNDVGEALNFIAEPANLREAVALKLLPESTPAYVALVASDKAAAAVTQAVKPVVDGAPKS